MPLPNAAAATAATANHDASASFVGEDGETAEESTANRATAAAAALATAAIAPNTNSTGTPRAAEPEHVSILDIITSVNASADIWGFALATWRGAENRDGFVLDIERLVKFGDLSRCSYVYMHVAINDMQTSYKYTVDPPVQELPCILHA